MSLQKKPDWPHPPQAASCSRYVLTFRCSRPSYVQQGVHIIYVIYVLVPYGGPGSSRMLPICVDMWPLSFTPTCFAQALHRKVTLQGEGLPCALPCTRRNCREYFRIGLDLFALLTAPMYMKTMESEGVLETCLGATNANK